MVKGVQSQRSGKPVGTGRTRAFSYPGKSAVAAAPPRNDTGPGEHRLTVPLGAREGAATALAPDSHT